VYALSALATNGYITGNVFICDNTVMPHVLARPIVKASVYPSVCPSVRHTLQLYQNSAGYITKPSLKLRKKTLVSGFVKVSRKFELDDPNQES